MRYDYEATMRYRDGYFFVDYRLRFIPRIAPKKLIRGATPRPFHSPTRAKR